VITNYLTVIKKKNLLLMLTH